MTFELALYILGTFFGFWFIQTVNIWMVEKETGQ